MSNHNVASLQGRHLFLLARNAKALKEVGAACEARGAVVTTFSGDVTKEEDMKRWCADINRKVTSVDLLIANAGVSAETIASNSFATVRTLAFIIPARLTWNMHCR